MDGARSSSAVDPRVSDEWLRALVAGWRDAILIVAADGRIADANPAAARLTGYAADELRGMDAAALLDDEGRRLREARLQDAAPGQTVTVEVRLTRKDGSTVEVELDHQPIGLGGVPHVHVVARDVSRRKSAERDLRAVLQLHQLTASASSLRELIQWVCSYFRRLTGAEAVGIRLRRGDDFPYYETSGFPGEFVLREKRLCTVDSEGETVRDNRGNPMLECMCGNILSGRFDPGKPFFTPGGSFWTNSTTRLLATTTEADRLARTRNRCNTAGYESLALVPLRCGQETIGLAQLNDRRQGLFDPGLLALLECLCGQAAAAVAHLLDHERLRESEAQLRQSEEQFRIVADYAYDWEFWMGPDRRFVYVSPSCERTTGYGPQAFLDDPGLLLDIVHPDDRPAVVRHLAVEYGAQGPAGLEFRVLSRNGEVRWIEHRCQPVFDGDGRFLGRRATNRDVTERKQAEEAMRLAGEIMANMAEGVVLVRSDNGTIVTANPRFEQMSGYGPGELIGRHVSVVNAPTDRTPEEIARDIMRCLRETGVWSGEVRNIRKDGTPFTCHATVSTFRHAEYGEVWISIHTDVTERKRAEEALRESEERLRVATDSSNTGLWDWDLRTNRVHYSPIWKRQLGCEEHEISDRFEEWRDRVHPEDLERATATVRSFVEKPWPGYEMECRLRHKDGSYRWILTKASLLLDEAGKPWRMIGSHIDITGRKQAEEALRESERLRMKAERLAALGRMAAVVAHEINNPLAGIRNCFWLLKNALPKYHKHYAFAETAEKEIDRIARIVEGMFHLQRPATRPASEVNVPGLVDDVATMLAPKCRDRGVAIDCGGVQRPLCAVLQEDAMRQIVVNLVSNAVDASPPQGTVKIAAQVVEELPGRAIELIVSDEGAGIPKEVGDLVFEPFYTTKTGGGASGLGLGLAIARGLVESMSGAIDYRTEPGRGTRFRAVIPVQ